MKATNRKWFALGLLRGAAVVLAIAVASMGAQAGVRGAIFTTNSSCTQVNGNIYDNKSDVYLNGGPPTFSALTPGDYYVQVTEPNGTTVLGTSVGATNPTPFHVNADGTVTACYQLWAILIKASDGTTGYDSTGNPGGEYKAWIASDAAFTNSVAKTDNFKVRNSCDPSVENCNPQPPHVAITGYKFYDANANGIFDAGTEVGLAGWEIDLSGGRCSLTGDGGVAALGSYSFLVDAADPPVNYTVAEGSLPTGWRNTTLMSGAVTVGSSDVTGPNFGNVCLGGNGGGLTLGFWSNKNGKLVIQYKAFNTPCVGGTVNVFSYLSSLNLRNGSGGNFDLPSDFTTAYPMLQSWLLSATATNMAYMLSAQLATMEMNVGFGYVTGTRLIYAPGTNSANQFGFASVCDVMSEANSALADPNGNTTAGGAARTYQEILKNALDNANNNRNFIQQNPAMCPGYSFTCPVAP